MRIRVSRSVHDVDGKEPALDLNDQANVYRVTIWLGGMRYQLHVSNGALWLSLADGGLVVEPVAANTITIKGRTL